MKDSLARTKSEVVAIGMESVLYAFSQHCYAKYVPCFKNRRVARTDCIDLLSLFRDDDGTNEQAGENNSTCRGYIA